MNNIAKVQKEFFELTDLKNEIEAKLQTETNPIEIKKLKLTLSSLENSIESADMEIKEITKDQEFKDFYQKRHIEDDDDAKEVWYEFHSMKANEVADEAFEKVVNLPNEPINSWES